MHKNATQLPKPHLTVINWDDRPSIVFYFTHNGSPYKPVFMVNPNFVSPFCALCARATSCKESCSSGCSRLSVHPHITSTAHVHPGLCPPADTYEHTHVRNSLTFHRNFQYNLYRRSQYVYILVAYLQLPVTVNSLYSCDTVLLCFIKDVFLCFINQI
jgi:hypothetical protein